jgi:hypothetical protein
MKIEVYALSFESEERTFSIPLCIGDDWLQKIKCPLAVFPTKMHLQWDTAYINFERYIDATAFGAWLVASEAKAQEGYRTMRG